MKPSDETTPPQTPAPSTHSYRDALARFTLKGTGYVDIKDADTYLIAKSYLKVLAKKLGIPETEEE